jgi:hypothetical protein
MKVIAATVATIVFGLITTFIVQLYQAAASYDPDNFYE